MEFRNYDVLKYTELKDECKRRGLSAGGKKADLVSRLQEHDSSKAAALEEAAKRPLDEVVEKKENKPEDEEEAGGTKKARTEEGVQEDEKKKKKEEEQVPSKEDDHVVPMDVDKPKEQQQQQQQQQQQHEEQKQDEPAEDQGGPASTQLVQQQSAESGDKTSTNTLACSIYITGLVRPFTEDSLRIHLRGPENVELVDLWLDNPVKTMAIAQFSSPSIAESVRQRIDGVVWPKLGKALVVVPCTAEHARLKPRAQRQDEAAAPAQEPVDVDDLFEKTTAKPPLYYTYNKNVQ